MAFSSDYYTWATAGGANVMTPAVYNALVARQQGAQSGIASSQQYNTAMRQASEVATMVAKFTADYGPSNVLDDGNIAVFETQFYAALQQMVNNTTGPFQGVNRGTDVGPADNMQVNDCTPAITGYLQNQLFLVRVALTNLTTAPKLQVAALGIVTIKRADNTACKKGDIQAGSDILLSYVGTNFQVVGLYTSFLPSATSKAYFVSNTLTIPAGIFRIARARVWGAGGGGGGSNGVNMSSSGGGGGGYVEAFDIEVNPGQVITMTIGGGGVGGIGSAYGAAGGTTSMNTLAALTATGGGGGSYNSVGVQGFGGTGTGGEITLPGTYGNVPSFIAGTTAVGGVGGNSPFSAGVYPTQFATSGGLNGGNGRFPGGGANGACTGSVGTAMQGGNGADGFIAIDF